MCRRFCMYVLSVVFPFGAIALKESEYPLQVVCNYRLAKIGNLFIYEYQKECAK